MSNENDNNWLNDALDKDSGQVTITPPKRQDGLYQPPPSSDLNPRQLEPPSTEPSPFNTWVSFAPGDLLKPEILVAQEKINQVAQLASSIIDGARTLIQLLGSAGGLQMNASVTALQGAFKGIQEMLDSLRNPGGVSLLLVPPRVDGGGTQHVADTFSASLKDEKDLCRPDFGPHTTYVGGILLVGAPTLKEILLAFSRLQGAFELDAYTPINVPRPRSLTATPIYFKGSLSRVSLSWDTARFVPRTSLPKYSVVRTKVYRWDYPGATIDEVHEASVVAEMDHFGAMMPTSAFKPAPRRVSALDSGSFSTEGLTYVVAYEVEIEEIAGTVETLTTYSSPVSLGVHQVAPEPGLNVSVGCHSGGGGVPPDWKTQRFGLGLSLPHIGQATDVAQHFLDSWLKSLTTTDNQLQNYIKMLERKAQRRLDEAERISRIIQRAADAVIALTKLGGGYYVIDDRQGDVAHFESTVRRALLAADPNKPPVDDLESYAAGVVIVAHAARPDAAFKETSVQIQSLWSQHKSERSSELRNACYKASAAAREIDESLEAVFTYDEDLKERRDDAAQRRSMLRGPSS